MIASGYLLCFLVSIAFSLLSTRWVRDYAIAHGWVASPELDRHVHTTSIPRLGGIAIFGSFMVVAALATLLPKSMGFGLDLPPHIMLSVFGSALIVFLLLPSPLSIIGGI